MPTERPETPENQGTEQSQEAAGRGVIRRRRSQDDQDGQDGQRRGRGRRMGRELVFGNGERKQPDGKAPLYDTTLKY